VKDLARLTPGLSAQSSNIFDTPDIAIRGVSSTAGSATTAIYIDDAPIAVRNLGPEAAGSSFPLLYDLDRVEVLRGPQGTLFGSGAEGGAIRFITPTPGMAKFEGSARLGVAAGQRGGGSFQAGAAVGGPIIANELALRVSAWRKHDGGFIDHVDRDTGAVTARDTNGQEASVARAALLWRPTSSLSITPSVYYQDDFHRDRATWYEAAGTYRTYNRQPQPTRDQFNLSSLAVAYDTDALEFKSVTSWFNRHQRRIDDFSYLTATVFTGGIDNEELPGYPNYLATNFQRTTQHVLTQEFRVSSNGDGSEALSWVGGLYLSRSRQTNHQYTAQDVETFSQVLFGGSSEAIFGEGGVGPGAAYSYLDDDMLRDRSVALFGEANFKLAPHTTFTAGLRAGSNSFDFSTHQDGPVAGGPIAFDGSQKGRALLPKLALSQEIGKSDLVYASAAKGNRVGGANPSYAKVPACAGDLAALGVADNPRTYDPDSLWSYELGYKTRLLDQRLEVAASVFRIDWKDIQQQVTLPTCLFSYTTNLGRARSAGGDLQLQFRATRSVLLSATAAYTDAHYTRDAGQSSAAGASPIVLDGDKLPEPPLSLAFGAEYDWVPAEGAKAFARIDYQHQSRFHRMGREGTLNYDAGLYDAPATDFFSLHGGWSAGPTSYSVYVDNLFDTHTQVMRTRNASTDPWFQGATFRPRTLGLTIDHKF
jgi:outer membrane receptor protein involved in Fe transport